MQQTSSQSLPQSLILVIFGGSGDLTKRKLIPSLYQLFKQGKLPERFAVLALGRTDYTDETYRPHLDGSLQRYLAEGEYDPSLAEQFLSSVHYLSMDPSEVADYPRLKEQLARLDERIGNPGNYIYYLSTPPSLYGVVPQHLAHVGLNKEEAVGADGEAQAIRRIVIEKPFGYDLASALELNEIYRSAFHEHQLYRIDHFLGKETVQDIMALRFANGIFEPLWNRNYIERVEITAVENMGIESRGGFYDQTGALRDMVQNHLAQLVALTAMEPPVQFNADLFRNEVVKVYQSFRPMTKEEIRGSVIRGQYTESQWKGEHHRAYREEDKIPADSRTETFVAMKLFIDNWRWQGVPFYIRTGKMMPTKVTEIVVHFRPTPHRMFTTIDGETIPNQLIIRIQPNEGISLKFAAKVPGSGFEVKRVSMNFTYDQLGGIASGDAYSRLLEDCMLGDSTLFTRSDAVEMSWRFFDPILSSWQEEDFPLYGYPAGTWGPKQSDTIIDREHSWTNPCRNLTNSELYCEL
ncbi:glucose-6-phosphate dehydrogenase [uncultured Porphyromonas sp.]|uniref:glucose-6-phosphate dehydrogenase n=1 Tax=uncultured Porphyromonas sp. TaxID=159274 RepID=UPI002629D6DF|nr:glucose-6-phosphate dehydrogenase [uncultured Porphyromonas sp.]